MKLAAINTSATHHNNSFGTRFTILGLTVKPHGRALIESVAYSQSKVTTTSLQNDK
jgi:hypothetical protein